MEKAQVVDIDRETSPQDIPDGELVRRLQEKDDLEAYEILVKRYERQAYGLAHTLVGNREDARDVLQESFFNVYRSIRSFRGEASFKTYFFKILTNRCRDFQRRRAVWGRFFLGRVGAPGETPEHEGVVEGLNTTTPYDALSEKELGEKIEDILKTLPIRQRTAFALKVINQMKIHEVADIMKLSEGAVKAHLFHAVRKVQRQLHSYLKGQDEGSEVHVV